MAEKSAVNQGAWLLGLEQGPYAGRWFRVNFHVCPNPCCDCGVVGFRCSSAEQPDLPMKFDLEIFDRRLQPWEPQDPKGVALGKAFMAEAGDPQWLALRSLFLEAKRRQMENMDLDVLQVQFPIEADGGSGLMFGYGEIFPWVEGLEFEHDSGRWLADDQYCVRPECDCAETALAFYELSAGSSESVGLRAACAVFYGYRSGELRLIERTSASPKPAVLVDALRGLKPDLNATLERRHQQLKQLARRLLPSSSRTAPGYLKGTRGDPSRPTDVGSKDEPVTAKKKPGRNAPCPCGSGKKYKRCCGAA